MGWKANITIRIYIIQKVLGRYKRYKTVHSVDVLGFYCSKGVYKKEDGNYSTRNVRFEGLGGGGSVGEKKTMTMNYFLSPSNLWIPEKYISINEKDISFVQTRVSTRGTGNSGTVVVLQEIHLFLCPLLFLPRNPTNYKAFNNRKFWRMMKKCSVITGMILASLLLFMNSCEKDYLNAEEISYSLPFRIPFI